MKKLKKRIKELKKERNELRKRLKQLKANSELPEFPVITENQALKLLHEENQHLKEQITEMQLIINAAEKRNIDKVYTDIIDYFKLNDIEETFKVFDEILKIVINNNEANIFIGEIREFSVLHSIIKDIMFKRFAA